jgi:hypothetical protein
MFQLGSCKNPQQLRRFLDERHLPLGENFEDLRRTLVEALIFRVYPDPGLNNMPRIPFG